jgi:hypothetical protein
MHSFSDISACIAKSSVCSVVALMKTGVKIWWEGEGEKHRSMKTIGAVLSSGQIYVRRQFHAPAALPCEDEPILSV